MLGRDRAALGRRASASAWSISASLLSRAPVSSASRASASASCGGQRVEAALGVLEPRHHLELVVLEQVIRRSSDSSSLLHPLEVLGVADQPLVHPVAGRARGGP